jgi:hypothetical protein
MATKMLIPIRYRVKWNGIEVIINKEVDGCLISTDNNAYYRHDLEVIFIPHKLKVYAYAWLYSILIFIPFIITWLFGMLLICVEYLILFFVPAYKNPYIENDADYFPIPITLLKWRDKKMKMKVDKLKK